MLLVAIFGSPRKNGNTDIMLETFLEGASSASGVRVERLYARDLRISGCLGCGHCDREGVCIQKDDMEKAVSVLDSADRVAMAAPIYFYGLPGQLKLMVDRSQAPFMRRELAKKAGVTSHEGAERDRKGFLLSAGATRGKRLFECAILTARYFFDALEIEWAGDLCFREVDARGDIRLHPTALDECRKAGMRFVS